MTNSPNISPSEREVLNSFSLGMFGFGAQGSAEATNLKRSGLHFRLGLRPEGASAQKARESGWKVESFEALAPEVSHLLMNLPDQVQSQVYERHLNSQKQLKYLIFPHGFASHFKLLPCTEEGPAHVLIAPKGAASGLVRLYGSPQALPAILAIRDHLGDREPTSEEKLWIEALAKAMGAHPQRLIWARFKDETVSDLFAEQVLLCGGVTHLLQRSYEVLVENGYHPEAAYFETLYELKLIVDLIWEHGIQGMRQRISPTARYGDLTRGDRIITEETKSRMLEVLREIESGQFAHEFLKKVDAPETQKLFEKHSQHPLEQRHQSLAPSGKSNV